MNNAPGMILEKTKQVGSDGECTMKNLQQLITLENEKLEAMEEIINEWYDQPRVERSHTINKRERKTIEEIKTISERTE